MAKNQRPEQTSESMAEDYSYHPARGHVLLLSCIDPRLLDDAVEFMNHDNLCNRYDQVTMAGAALGALGGGVGANPPKEHWRKTFFEHLGGAYDLHQIEEVYIIEHRGCGAYEKIFKVHEKFGDDEEQLELEAALHWYFADMLREEIENWCHDRNSKEPGDKIALTVKLFLMDLRGWCKLLKRPDDKVLTAVKKSLDKYGHGKPRGRARA